jgi:hypothetical protein
MGFHAFVRGIVARLAAAILIALLAVPGFAPTCPAGEHAASSAAPGDAVTATPTHAAVTALTVTPAAVMAPPAAATPRVLFGSHPHVGPNLGHTTQRRPVRPKPSPTVLRV